MKEEHLEVRRRHGPTTLEKLKWHLGTLAAVVLGALLLLQIFGVILRPSEDSRKTLEGLQAACGRVESTVEGRAFPLEERLKEVDDKVGQLRTTFKHHPTPVEAGAGITYPVAYLKTLKPGESNEIRFQAPTDLTAVAEAGGVDLKWAEGANNNVKVGSFELLRKEGGAEPVSIKVVEGTVHTYRDTTAQPGHTYEYTVRAIASDADLANTPRGRSPSSAPASAKAVADFKVEFVSRNGEVATFKVSKWHEGSWRERTFEVKEGETIGKPDPALGIDFSTGRLLSKLTVTTSEVPVTRAELVFDSRGRVVVEGDAPKRVVVSGVENHEKTTASITGGGLPDEVLELEKS
jgi:hypothetical protein